MPKTRVVFYQEEDGTVPVLKWLDALPKKARVKCRLRIERLQELGHELRRPEADYLRDASMSFEQVSKASTTGSSTSFTETQQPSSPTE